VVRELSQVGHPHRLVWFFGQTDEDLEIRQGQLMAQAQLPVQRLDEPHRTLNEGTPISLLFIVEPFRHGKILTVDAFNYIT
jgi:hypothetical protein